MLSVTLINTRTGLVVGNCVWKADSFWTRLRGLIGRKEIKQGCGLWILPCQQVHTFFMKYPLSIWYIEKSGRVCHIIDKLEPWKISPRHRNAESIIEFPEGWANVNQIQLGDTLVYKKN